jgi:hypothetical protein
VPWKPALSGPELAGTGDCNTMCFITATIEWCRAYGPGHSLSFLPHNATSPQTQDQTPMNVEHISFRLSAADSANLAAIAAALTDDVKRPQVSTSDALRAALRIAAGSLTLRAPTAGVA